MYPIKQIRRSITRRNPTTPEHQDVEYGVEVGWMRRIHFIAPRGFVGGHGRMRMRFMNSWWKKWVLYSTLSSCHDDSQNHTIRPRSQDYEECPGHEPCAIHLFHERTAVTMIVRNRVANKWKSKILYQTKAVLQSPLAVPYSMPTIMASLCSLWKGGSDKVLVWPAMPTIGGVMMSGVKSPWIQSPLWKKCYILAGSKGGVKTYCISPELSCK